MVMNKEALFLQGFNLRRNLTENLYVTHIPLSGVNSLKIIYLNLKMANQLDSLKLNRSRR